MVGERREGGGDKARASRTGDGANVQGTRAARRGSLDGWQLEAHGASTRAPRRERGGGKRREGEDSTSHRRRQMQSGGASDQGLRSIAPGT
jgi:hypothetical protein